MQVFLVKFFSKQTQNSLPPFWIVLSNQAAFSWRHFVQGIRSKWLPKRLLTTTLDYGCSWAILFWAKPGSSNLRNDSIESSKEENRSEKLHFVGLVKNTQSVAGFCLALTAKYNSKWRLPSRFFREEFHQKKRHFKGWNFSEWKSWMFTCYRWRQKSKLPWVT